MSKIITTLVAVVMAVAMTVAFVPTASAMGIPGISIRVLTPNGGEQWKIGTTQSITWQGVETGGPYTIQIQRHPRQKWQTIAIVPDNGTYNWKVTGPVTKQALIKVSTKEPDGKTYSDTSDAVFSIVKKPVSPR